MVHTVSWLEYLVLGDSAPGYHGVNIALHAINAVLVGLLLRRLRLPGAYLAAGFFALHPVMVESVAWMTEIKNTLSGLFSLGAALAYLRFDEHRGKRWHAFAAGLFVLALLSKTTAATLPGALLVVLWWRHGRLSWRRDVRPLLPFFALAAADGLLVAWVEWQFVGARGSDFDFTFVERGLIAGHAVWFYLGKLVWPAELIFMYPRWPISQAVAGQYGYPAGVLLALAALWGLRRRMRGPLAAALYFIGTLFPVLGFLNVYMFKFSFVADHHQYLASLGVMASVAAGLTQLGERWRGRWPGARAAAAGLALGLLATLGVLTWRQSRMYRDADTLYRTTLAQNPACWMAYNNLGVSRLAAGRAAEAIRPFEEALRLKPDFTDAHNNLGNALAGTGRAAEAIVHYQEALRLQPDFPEAHNNWGNTLAQAGRLPEAMQHYKAALQLRPDYAEAQYNLGNTLGQLGRVAAAIAPLERALVLRPDYAQAHIVLAGALMELNRVAEAEAQYEEGLRLQPDSCAAHAGLGNLLVQTGRPAEAIRHYEEALRLKPGQAQVQSNLGFALVQAGRPEEGIRCYAEALRLDAGNAQTHYNLGNVLYQSGRVAEAIQQYEESLRIKPDSADTHNNLAGVLVRAGRIDEAIRQYEEALRINPNYATARANLTRLQAVRDASGPVR
jgi:tetratricopeptide (TPR) repeat protein